MAKLGGGEAKVLKSLNFGQKFPVMSSCRSAGHGRPAVDATSRINAFVAIFASPLFIV